MDSGEYLFAHSFLKTELSLIHVDACIYLLCNNIPHHPSWFLHCDNFDFCIIINLIIYTFSINIHFQSIYIFNQYTFTKGAFTLDLVWEWTGIGTLTSCVHTRQAWLWISDKYDVEFCYNAVYITKQIVVVYLTIESQSYCFQLDALTWIWVTAKPTHAQLMTLPL